LLAIIQPGAGRALGQTLAAMVDAQAATLLADADGRARVRLYWPAWFAEAASTTRPLGHAAVFVRQPRPHSTDLESMTVADVTSGAFRATGARSRNCCTDRDLQAVPGSPFL